MSTPLINEPEVARGTVLAGARMHLRGPVLLATDGQSTTDASALAARTLATQLGVSLKVVSAMDPRAPFGAGVEAPWSGARSEAMRRGDVAYLVRNRLMGVLGAPSTWELMIPAGVPARAIASCARETSASLLVMGRGNQHLLERIAGEALPLQVTRLSTTPVLAVAPDMLHLPRLAVAAVDFSAASVVAARMALQLLDGARDETRRLVLLHVTPWTTAGSGHHAQGDDVEADAVRMFDKLEAILAPDVPEGVALERRVVRGDVERRLLAEVSSLCADLVAIGTQGPGLLERLFIGSTAMATLRHAPTSVLIAPPPSAAERVRLELQLWERVTLDRPNEWKEALQLFTRRNFLRNARLEIINGATGFPEVQVDDYAFEGASWDPYTRRIDLMFCSTAESSRHLTHGVTYIESLEIVATETGSDHALIIEDARGCSVLTFHEPGRNSRAHAPGNHDDRRTDARS